MVLLVSTLISNKANDRVKSDPRCSGYPMIPPLFLLSCRRRAKQLCQSSGNSITVMQAKLILSVSYFQERLLPYPWDLFPIEFRFACLIMAEWHSRVSEVLCFIFQSFQWRDGFWILPHRTSFRK